MKVTDTSLPDVKLVHLDVHGDARGFFIERFHAARFRQFGLPTDFVQDNHSRSAPNILRGLHYQYDPPQGKLVGVTRGRILDVAVDIRPGSPTFGRHASAELTAENGLLLWIPAGFAHGFCVLGDEPADVAYKVTALYNAAGEGGIMFDDTELGIGWPLKNPQISERDRQQQSFADYRNNPPRWTA